MEAELQGKPPLLLLVDELSLSQAPFAHFRFS
jgi:hypothetical protein